MGTLDATLPEVKWTKQDLEWWEETHLKFARHNYEPCEEVMSLIKESREKSDSDSDMSDADVFQERVAPRCGNCSLTQSLSQTVQQSLPQERILPTVAMNTKLFIA